MTAAGRATLGPSALAACCAGLYGHPLVELVAGESLHPGGLSTTRRLLAEARLPWSARLLDAGCGLGASSRAAALEFGLVVDACDVSASALDRAAILAKGAGASIRFRTASLLRLPYPDATFAAVLAECVLSTTSKREGLDELRRVTAAGGWLLVSDVTSSGRVSLPEPLASVLCLAAAWAPGELEERLLAAGFEVVRAWDETAGVSSLVDRLEARIGLLATVARDIGGAGPLVDLGLDAGTFRDPARVAAVFAEIRELVASGRIGYRAVLARARRGRDVTPIGVLGRP